MSAVSCFGADRNPPEETRGGYDHAEMTFQPLVKKLPLSVLLALAMGASVALTTGCSVSIGSYKKTGGTYHAHGVSFKIPYGWRRMSLTKQTETGNEIWSESFGPRSGSDLVGVTAYATKFVVTQKNAAERAPDVAASLKDTLTSAGGILLDGPTLTAIGDMAGYRFETAFPGENGVTLQSRLLMVWNGHTEYFFNCQHAKGSPRNAEIKRGCETITSTFKLA